MNRERLKAVVRGAVQGVGFRPFVYRLAASLGLNGWVSNTSQGVLIEVEGARVELDQFLFRLEKEKPERAIIQGLEFSFLDASGYTTFEIRESNDGGGKTALIQPDIAPCSACLAEIFDPNNRRHFYPFTNCTNCGPRFTIIESLPYDRANTSMKRFAMCPECAAEYEDPNNRRFHAQPNGCSICGPQLALWDTAGAVLSERHDALAQAAEAVRNGKILALKGVGGFQFIVDARNDEAIRRLRACKRREEKPFALMYPSLDYLGGDCHVDQAETRLLASAEAPIVLLRRNDCECRLAPSIGPGNPNLGVMLPASPLHHILMRQLAFPVVATSGNLNSEPIAFDDTDALRRLRGIADVFLVHNRPIVRPVDDSILRIVMGREMMIRRARGYAPLPIHVNRDLPAVLAVGAHLKNTVAWGIGREIFLSQHIGDLETGEAWTAFRRTAADLPRLYDFNPESVACDAHPDYLSTKYAQSLGLPVVQVQHHYAHVLACMAENELDGPLLGVSWDGTGLGADDTIWGGEFLLVDETSFVRFAHLRNFRLPGGEAAIKQPRRAALGLLWEILGDTLFTREDFAFVRRNFTRPELDLIHQMLANGINAPGTSSAGRLFDAVASILGLRQHSYFEGQAAMELEFLSPSGVERSYPFSLNTEAGPGMDWQPMIQQILHELKENVPMAEMAAAFHNTLAEMIVTVAQRAGLPAVVLTGGCFQNRLLLERTVARLRQHDLRPYWHQRIPPNDGGIAAGQILGAARAAMLPREERAECLA
jgi:hydrogenase maturation protein HypF